MRHGIVDLGNPPSVDHATEAVRALRMLSASGFPWHALIPYHRGTSGIQVRWDLEDGNMGLTWANSPVRIAPWLSSWDVPWILAHELGHRTDQALYYIQDQQILIRLLHSTLEHWHFGESTLDDHVNNTSWEGDPSYTARMSEANAQSVMIAYAHDLGRGADWYPHAVDRDNLALIQQFRNELEWAAARVVLYENYPLGHPHRPGVEWAAGEGIFEWPIVWRSTFDGGVAITRGYLAALLKRYHDTQKRLEPPANPVPVWCTDITGHPLEPDIRWAMGLSIVGGYGDGTFKPDVAVNRHQTAKFLANFIDHLPPLPDIRLAPAWTDVDSAFRPFVDEVYRKGIMSGTGPTTFNGGGYLTREAIATTLKNLRDRVAEAGS